MTIRILCASDVRAACSMADAIDAVATGFVALSTGQATAPVRLSVPLADQGVALTMPASSVGLSCYSVKVVSVLPANRAAGGPLVTATVLLIDASSGALLALIDGTALTALRTGAAGGLAARTLAAPGASRVALFGAGAQARSQLLGLVAVRPVQDVRIVTRDPGHAAAFREWAASTPALAGIAITPADPEAAVAGADIVVTATSSGSPVFPGVALSPGVHVTAVGAFTSMTRELDEETMRGARVFVDQRAAALAEAGELQHLGPKDVTEIGEVINGSAAGRIDVADRTIFKSVGNAIQDLVVAARSFERAQADGIGTVVTFP